MINNLIHQSKVLLSHFRTITTGKKRSNKWRQVEKKFLKENPLCAVCGTHKKLQVHHIKPFHLFPELELEESNLITLCMDTYECHLQIGHRGSFRKFNENIKEDAEQIKKDFSQFKKIANQIKNNIIS